MHADMLQFMRDHELLLALVARQQPLRYHDFGAGHAHHRRADVARDAHRRAMHHGLRPSCPQASIPPVHAGKGDEQRDTGCGPPKQQPDADRCGHHTMPAAPHRLHTARQRGAGVDPRGAQHVERIRGHDGGDAAAGRGGLPAPRHRRTNDARRRHDAECDRHHQGADPGPARGTTCHLQRRFRTERGQCQQTAQQRELPDPPGDHGASPSRWASNRRMRSNSGRLSRSSATKCANSFSADP